MPDPILGGLVPHAQFLTMVILLINSGLYAATLLFDLSTRDNPSLTDISGQTLVLFGSKYYPAINAGQLWRLVTAGFLHAGLLHIAMNSWAMFDLGANVEEGFGTSRMIVIYFVATVAGFWLSYIWTPANSVGASAGIFGLIGAMIAYGTHRSRSVVGQMIKTHYSRWAVYGILLGLIGIFPIDNAAHLGGLGGGFVVAWVAGLPMPGNWKEKLWNWLAAGCLALTAFAFAQIIYFFLSRS